MAEYIERGKMLDDFDLCNKQNPRWTPQRVKSLIVRANAADVAPVVRCQDCEQSRETNMFGERTVLICGKTDYVKQPDGYCDEGERKDGDG